MRRETWIAYRLGAIEHRVEQLEQSWATAKRIILFSAISLVAVLSNMNTEGISDALRLVVKFGLLIF